ncbi:MAG: AAA family ATPase [Bacteroidales bacterium]
MNLQVKKKKKLDIKPKSERKIVSPMVGRSREADQLEGLIKNLVAGKGSIVNIVGKAGIGKSRLMAEIKVQPIMEKLLLLEGRAVSTGQNLSFHPITNLIKSWAGITEDDLPSVSSEKLYQGIKHNTPEQADEIYAFVATMMGLPLEGKYKERVKGIEGEALEKLILKNLRDLIIAATRDKPRIYMIEDMHWADSSSITMLESLFKLSGSHRVMFINILRPGYKETGDYILKYLVDNLPGDHITINISPLANAESSELIGNLLQQVQLPDEIKEVIIKKTEGNPFFIEEVIRSFIDEGIVEIKDNLFRVTDKIHTAKIPETINDVILSRVDKLDEKTRELLNTASVMGRNFYYKVLEEATDTIEELDERLEYLKDVQLISESKPKEDIEFLFKHALAQQLTYDSIIQQSRKDLHLKIARSIEKVFAENIQDYYGTLAYHYTKAENEEKTIQYLILAGDESMKSGASSEALNYYKDALNRLPESRKNDNSVFEIRDLQFKVAFAYHAIGKNIEARAGFEALTRKYFGYNILDNGYPLIYRGIISMLKFIFVINNQSLFFKRKVDDDFHLFARTIKQWGEAIATANPRTFAFNGFHILIKLSKYQLHDSIHGLAVFVESSSMYMWTGISFNVSSKMLEYAEKGGAGQHPVSRATYRFILKMYEFMTGDWKVDEDFQQVYEMGARVGHFWPLTIYVMYSGMVNIELGKFDALLDNVKKLNEISDTFDNSHAKAQMYRMMVPGYYRFRRLDEAIKLADEGIDYTRKTGHFAMLMVLYCSKSQVLTLKGQLNEARLAFNEADKLIEHHKIITIYYCPYLLAKVKLEFEELKSLSKSDKNYKSKLKQPLKTSDKLISKSKKMIGSLTEAYLVRAQIDIFLNKQKKAFKNLQLAIQAGEKYNGRLELSRAYFETGKFLSDPKVKYNELNGHPASHYLEKAKTMFNEMDLQWDLEEYGKFVNQNPS